jgi:uncharacterized membrane protein YhhN
MKKFLNLKNVILAVNIVFILEICVMNYFYQKNDFDFTLKCVCSISFAVLGLINLGYAIFTKQENLKFFIVMAVGLVFAMTGDIVLEIIFVAGAGFFAIGHIVFVAAYCLLKKMGVLEFIVAAITFVLAGSFLLFSKQLDFGGELMKWVCVIYALIISLMFGKAVANFIYERNVFYALIAVGSLLFVFSDLMLVLNNFIGKWNWTEYACLATYYPALCLFTFSMFFKTLTVKKETLKVE